MKNTRTRSRKPIQPVQFVCLRCPSNRDGVPLVRAKSDETEAQCPRCHKYYKIDTFSLEGTPEEIQQSSTQSRYQLTYRDTDGSLKTHSFRGQSMLTYPDKSRFVDDGDSTVTLVHTRGNLVEIANQTRQQWVRIFSGSTRSRGAQLLCAVGILIYIATLMQDALSRSWDQLQSGPALLWAAPALAVMLIILPVLAWVFRPTR